MLHIFRTWKMSGFMSGARRQFRTSASEIPAAVVKARPLDRMCAVFLRALMYSGMKALWMLTEGDMGVIRSRLPYDSILVVGQVERRRLLVRKL